MYSVYTYLIEELRHGNDVKGWFLTFATSPLMRSMNAEAVLKHRVHNEQTSGQKKSPSKGVLIFYFFPAHMQIFRPIGQSFGSRRERVKLFRRGREKACPLTNHKIKEISSAY
jgi:hypothetical protein